MRKMGAGSQAPSIPVPHKRDTSQVMSRSWFQRRMKAYGLLRTLVGATGARLNRPPSSLRRLQRFSTGRPSRSSSPWSASCVGRHDYAVYRLMVKAHLAHEAYARLTGLTDGLIRAHAQYRRAHEPASAVSASVPDGVVRLSCPAFFRSPPAAVPPGRFPPCTLFFLFMATPPLTKTHNRAQFGVSPDSPELSVSLTRR
jgi:hypothetical protein